MKTKTKNYGMEIDMDLKTQFDEAIKNSVQYREHFNQNRTDNRYYADEYANEIRTYFDAKKFSSLETNYNPTYKCTPICALASSARLCYLYFKDKDDVIFEKPLKNDLKRSKPSKMDAVIQNTYYECKCQEIVSKSHTPLKKKYLRSAFFQEFNIKNYAIKQCISKKDQKTKIEKYLTFNVKELEIDLPNNPDYTHLHFDIKQLICHLIALANQDKNNEIEKELHYIFFKPTIQKNQTKLSQLYDDLEEELEAILSSDSKIISFADKHNITITHESIDIKGIKDFNYNETWGNN